jgi:TrkA-N domain/RyR domain
VTPASPERRHAIEWAAIGVMSALALALGTAGFAKLDHSLTESLYRAVQLFVLEGGSGNGTIPLSLEIARWLAPFIAGYAAVRALVIVFRERLQATRVRLLFRLHDVIAGLGSEGFMLAVALKDSGRRVVVIATDERSPLVEGCRRREIPVIIGDPVDPVVLGRARVAAAAHLVVVTGDDRRNIDVAFSAARSIQRDRSALTVLAHLDDLRLWRLLQAEAVVSRSRLPFRLDFFNLREGAARALLDEYPPFSGTGPDTAATPHVLLVGLEGFGESLLLRIAGLWQATRAQKPLPVTVASDGAAIALELLRAREPALDRLCAFNAIDLSPAAIASAVERGHGGSPTSAAYVCLPSEAESLSIGLALDAAPALSGVPIVVVVRDSRSGLALALRDDETNDLCQFGLLERALTPAMLEQGTSEALARAKHEHYVECELERGTPADENASMVPWSRLADSLKESNRRFADSVGVKLAEARCTLVPAPLADPATPRFAFTDDEVEWLGRAEHDRWCTDLEADGWRWGATKDAAARLHPKLVPWERLTEDDRDKDREPIRQLPEMLARVGFEIQRGSAPHILTRVREERALGSLPGRSP